MLIFLSPVPIRDCCRLSWLLGGFPVLHTGDYTLESAYKVVFDNALEGALIIYKIPRYDVKGREILKTLEKYYKVKDHYPKFVVTMDEDWHDNIQGIRHKHIADFLLMEELV